MRQCLVIILARLSLAWVISRQPTPRASGTRLHLTAPPHPVSIGCHSSASTSTGSRDSVLRLYPPPPCPQEKPEDVPTGELPRTVMVVADRQCCSVVTPGTRVTITGIYSTFKVGWGSLWTAAGEEVLGGAVWQAPSDRAAAHPHLTSPSGLQRRALSVLCQRPPTSTAFAPSTGVQHRMRTNPPGGSDMQMSIRSRCAMESGGRSASQVHHCSRRHALRRTNLIHSHSSPACFSFVLPTSTPTPTFLRARPWIGAPPRYSSRTSGWCQSCRRRVMRTAASNSRECSLAGGIR
jgi:hypothetical protein